MHSSGAGKVSQPEIPIEVANDPSRNDRALIARLLDVIELEIAPQSEAAVRQGNKIFGAAILRKSDLSTVIAGTNHETENPLWHDEIDTIKQYYEMANADESKRHPPRDGIFLATHEPCTLCASAIAWSGYVNFYGFFSHEDSRDTFQSGHDLNILKEIYKFGPGEYARDNAYWTANSMPEMIQRCGDNNRIVLLARAAHLRESYSRLSEIYQENKDKDSNIVLT